MVVANLKQSVQLDTTRCKVHNKKFLLRIYTLLSIVRCSYASSYKDYQTRAAFGGSNFDQSISGSTLGTKRITSCERECNVVLENSNGYFDIFCFKPLVPLENCASNTIMWVFVLLYFLYETRFGIFGDCQLAVYL